MPIADGCHTFQGTMGESEDRSVDLDRRRRDRAVGCQMHDFPGIRADEEAGTAISDDRDIAVPKRRGGDQGCRRLLAGPDRGLSKISADPDP